MSIRFSIKGKVLNSFSESHAELWAKPNVKFVRAHISLFNIFDDCHFYRQLKNNKADYALTNSIF